MGVAAVGVAAVATVVEEHVVVVGAHWADDYVREEEAYA